MSHAPSERGLQTLQELDARPEVRTSLSFIESASLITAEWATRRFASRVLIDHVLAGYSSNPTQDREGNVVHPTELGGTDGHRLRAAQETAEIDGLDIADDLKSAMRRVSRGYSLGQVSLHGNYDVVAVIGSLERAVEVDPENLEPHEAHFQAAARYMLERLQVVDSDIGNSRSYLL